jgi:hypothetical protein
LLIYAGAAVHAGEENEMDELILALTRVLKLSSDLAKGDGSNARKMLAWSIYNICRSALRQVEAAIHLKQIEAGQGARDVIPKYTVPGGYEPPIFAQTCSRCKGSGIEP